MINPETHQPTEAAKNAMNVFAQFETEDRAKFIKEITPEAYAQYTIIKNGQLAGKTSDIIQRELSEEMESRGKSDIHSSDWRAVTGKDTTKREYVSGLYKDITGQNPQGKSVGELMEYYTTGLKNGKGDHDYAKQYLRDMVDNKSENYLGQPIHGATDISSQLTDHTLPQLLAAMERDDVNLMTGLITSVMGNTGNEEGNLISKLSGPELSKSVQFDMAADGGLWIKSLKFQNDIYVSVEMLQSAERVVVQRNKVNQFEKEIRESSQKEYQKIENITQKYGSKHF